jgi:Flp pilus assembly protein TadG
MDCHDSILQLKCFSYCFLLRFFKAKPAQSKCLQNTWCGSESGGALVEMAIALPVMMLFITAMVSFGLMLSEYLVLSHAVDVGARNLALSRGATTNPCSDGVTAIQNSAPTIAASGLNYTFQIGSDSFSGNSSGFSGTGSTSCSQLGVSDMVAGDTATVTATYPVQLMVYGWAPKTLSITASTAEVIQ